jgi:hypothetical protein
MNKPKPTAVSTRPTFSDDELDALYDRLGQLIEQCGNNKNDRAVAAIGACILEGIDTKPHILGVLKRHFTTSHLSIMLDGGNKSMRHDIPWRLDKATGRYILID